MDQFPEPSAIIRSLCNSAEVSANFVAEGSASAEGQKSTLVSTLPERKTFKIRFNV